MKTEFTVLGLDVSKSSITCHALASYPRGGLQAHWAKTRNKLSSLYPVFYSNPDGKKQHKSAFDFANYLQEIKPDYAVMEPTGNHYSKIWAVILKELGIPILWVGHVELRRYRQGKNLPNKSDPADALAMAAYPLDSEHKLEDGTLNLKRFLIVQTEEISQLRDLCQKLEHLNRVQSPVINYARQLLAWQFPEVAHSSSTTSKPGMVPPLWGWLAGRESEVFPNSWKSYTQKYEKSVSNYYKIPIDPVLRSHADWLCDIALIEQSLDTAVAKLLQEECFKPYAQLFDSFGFGLRVRARLLSRIYPFESFLTAERKQMLEHEVKSKNGNARRNKRNRSRDAFKLRLGMGTVLEQSGDEVIEKPSGSSICRMSLWQYVLCQVETGRIPSTPIGKEILAYRDNLKSFTNTQGDKLLKGKHVQSKLMGKVINLLYRELFNWVVKQESPQNMG